MNLFISKIKEFSKENWWIYVILFVCLFLVYKTGKGNLAEIIILFLANFVGNVFIMIMQDYYTAGKNKLGSISQLISMIIFGTMSVYGFIFAGESQYLIFQLSYLLCTVKTLLAYNTDINTKFLNEYSMLIINVIALFVFFNYFYSATYQVFQVIGFSLITIGLVSIRDKVRYWLNVVGIFLLSFGSGYGVFQNYLSGSIEGINLGYFLLTATVFVFYIKLLPKYLKNA